MPWELKNNCVYKKGEDKPLKCYDNPEEAKKYMDALYANEGKSFDFADDVLVFAGGAVKDLGDGKIGGYAIMYSESIDPDLTKEFFSKGESMIDGPHENSPIFYVHGRDTKMGKKIIGRTVSSKVDEFGVWVETQLQTRDEYEKAILSMAKAGKLGYSTGALSHMVDYEPKGNGVQLIKTWVIGEVSLTPTPAEPRLFVQSLKSLTPVEMAALPNETEVLTQNNKEKYHMTDEIDVKAVVAAALAERDAAVKAEANKVAALKASEEAGYKKAVEELTAKKMLKVAPAFVKEVGDDNDGVQAFKSWLRSGAENEGLIRPDESWNVKTAYGVGGMTIGGALVPDPLYQQIIAKRQLQSWVRKAPVQTFVTPADHLLVPVEGTVAANFTLTNEFGAYTENEPTVAQVDIILYKYTKQISMSEEFISFNGTNFDAWLTDALARCVSVTENTIYSVGSGTGEPQGIRAPGVSTTYATAFSSATAPTSLDLTRLIGSLPAGYNIESECGFLMRNVTKWILKANGATIFAYLPTPQGNDFFNYPAYTSDDLQLIGTTGAVGSVIFANFNYYGVVEKPGLLIQRNPYLHMGTGQIDLFANMYRGGAVLQGEAIIMNTNA